LASHPYGSPWVLPNQVWDARDAIWLEPPDSSIAPGRRRKPRRRCSRASESTGSFGPSPGSWARVEIAHGGPSRELKLGRLLHLRTNQALLKRIHIVRGHFEPHCEIPSHAVTPTQTIGTMHRNMHPNMHQDMMAAQSRDTPPPPPPNPPPSPNKSREE
jgi:hypothetical protein